MSETTDDGETMDRQATQHRLMYEFASNDEVDAKKINKSDEYIKVTLASADTERAREMARGFAYEQVETRAGQEETTIVFGREER